MKLLTSIAAIVSLAAAGQVYHTPDVFQHLEFQQQPLFQFHQFPEHEQFQIQTQNDVKPIHEVQIEPQPIQHVQLPHQPVHHQPVHHQPVVHHQPIQHFQPQAEAEQHHGFSFKGFESFQAQQPHQSTPQVHQTHQVHQPKVHIAPQVHQSRLQAQSSHQGLQDQRHGQGHQEGLDKVAKIINHQHDTDGHNYQYMYETENGIKIQEIGSTAGKGSQAQGAYSYTGDDGQVYTVTYTADENGFHAQGAHLPTPPPMPEEIARSIEANARDAANGIVDDGQYQAHHHHQGQQQQQQNHQQHQDFQQNGYQQRHNFGQSSLNSEY